VIERKNVIEEEQERSLGKNRISYGIKTAGILEGRKKCGH